MSRLSIVMLSLLAAGAARAQAPGSGSCTGQLAGTVGLGVAASSGGYTSVPASLVPDFFGPAECECDAGDVALEIRLTQALSPGQTGLAEVWVGKGCDDYAQRTGGACRKLATVDTNLFTTTGSGLIDIPLPVRELFGGTCDDKFHLNDVYVVLFEDAQQPFAGCSLALAESGQRPPPPENVRVTRTGHHAHVTWDPPSLSTFVPGAYQIVCSTAAGQVASVPHKAAYSICLDNALERRDFDAADAATVSRPQSLPDSPADNVTTLDYAFICSEVIPPGAARDVDIELTTDDPIKVVVASIDAYGAATGSAPVVAEAAHPAGGCAAAPGRPASAGLLAVAFAAAGLALMARRRARARAAR